MFCINFQNSPNFLSDYTKKKWLLGAPNHWLRKTVFIVRILLTLTLYRVNDQIFEILVRVFFVSILIYLCLSISSSNKQNKDQYRYLLITFLFCVFKTNFNFRYWTTCMWNYFLKSQTVFRIYTYVDRYSWCYFPFDLEQVDMFESYCSC